MAYAFEDKRSDAKLAFDRARRYHAELKEIHRYFTPFRAPTSERSPDTGGTSEGGARTHQIYDGTGPSSAFAFVSNMKADWMPALQEFFKLQNGPLYVGNNAEDRAVALGKVTDVVHALTRKVRATVIDQTFADLFCGTGHVVLQPGDRTREPIRGFAPPVLETAIEAGPYDDIERWFWQRRHKARHIERLFEKEIKVGQRLGALLRDSATRDQDVTVVQYTYWDARSTSFRFCAWVEEGDQEAILEDEMMTAPWITPRMFVVPGEPFGRGLGHLGLPFVKTVNKARELALRAAAFALLGLWTRRNDGIFNPQTAKMVPGAMWKVASNASGGLGKSIERLDIPHNFDISTVIIKDEREQIRRVLLDDELPELTDRVRSPTEIAGRMRRYERNRGGATTRLAFELVAPFVQRSVDILAEHKLLPVDLRVDQILTEAAISAPAAAAQNTDKIERIVSWLQIMTGLVGPQMTALVAKVEEIMPEIGRYAGVDEKFVRRKTEAEMLKQLIEATVQQKIAAMKEEARNQPPAETPAGPEPVAAQPYLNGGF